MPIFDAARISVCTKFSRVRRRRKMQATKTISTPMAAPSLTVKTPE